MTTEVRMIRSKDEFFDMLDTLMKQHRKDDTLSHIMIVAIHAGGMDEGDDGHIVNAPVTFTHNLADNYEAAVLGNNVCAHIAMREAQNMENATKQ